jgi:hypothetical protein
VTNLAINVMRMIDCAYSRLSPSHLEGIRLYANSAISVTSSVPEMDLCFFAKFFHKINAKQLRPLTYVMFDICKKFLPVSFYSEIVF